MQVADFIESDIWRGEEEIPRLPATRDVISRSRAAMDTRRLSKFTEKVTPGWL